LKKLTFYGQLFLILLPLVFLPVDEKIIKKSSIVHIQEYPAGIYLLEVEVNGKIEVKKIIRR